MIGLLNHLDKSFVVTQSRALLEQFGLSEAANRTVKTYSGGMRRRLDLGAALVANPPLLFLDEPTTGLDPQSRQDLWAIIEGLVEQGVTVLLTTQYLEEADRLCKQMVVLDHGKIIAEGTSEELKTRLGSTVLSVTFNNTEDARRGAELISVVSTKPANVEGTVVDLTVEHGPSQAADALRRLDGAGIILAGLTLREPSLDDVFLHLTGHKTEDADPASSDAPAKRRDRKARA
jgi:ABC-2 type transport system ATP-binding protein